MFARLGDTVDEVKEQQRGQRSALKGLTVTLAEDVVYEKAQELSQCPVIYIWIVEGNDMQVRTRFRIVSSKIQMVRNNSLPGERMRERDYTCWRSCIYEYRVCV